MSRCIKIEEMGDYARKKTVPSIRLKGKWLQAAGFPPGQHLQLKVVALGCLELRVITESESREQKAHRQRVAECLEAAAKQADALLALHRAAGRQS